jgi:acetoin utilization deacetylase AcuC-like enzyme
MSLTLIFSERFADHRTPPGHPERADRAGVMEGVAARARMRGVEVTAPHPAAPEQLARVHSTEYLGMIAETAGRAVALDPDTYTSPESHAVALLAAGAAVDGVERVFDPPRDSESGNATNPLRAAMALVRPPGHHAERSRAMGFCLYNNIAVAAAHARTLGASRVAIVDYDVHHGNGTQHTFDADPDVLYVSLHQFPFYPGTGAADEIGRGPGNGFTVNLPLEAGSTDEDYRVAFEEVVVPVLRQYDPDVLLVSAGFDAHERDPLAGMRLTSAAFGAMTFELRRVAQECCGGRLVLVTEGGYDLQALDASLQAAIDALVAGPAAVAESPWPRGAAPSRRGRAAVEAARRAHVSSWKL